MGGGQGEIEKGYEVVKQKKDESKGCLGTDDEKK